MTEPIRGINMCPINRVDSLKQEVISTDEHKLTPLNNNILYKTLIKTNNSKITI